MRRRLSLFAALLAIALSVVSLPAAPACACSCARPSERTAQERADLVFDGVVLAVGGRDHDPVHRVEFAVDSLVKGSAAARVAVITASGTGSCGFEFELGRRYRVYVTGGGTGLCSGNRLLEPAGGPGGGPSGAVGTDAGPPSASPTVRSPETAGPAGTGPGTAVPTGPESAPATASPPSATNRLATNSTPVGNGAALGWLAAGAVLAGAGVLAAYVIRRRRTGLGRPDGPVGPSA